MPILKWIAPWKHLFYPLDLSGVLSNFLRFRCLSFRCPSLGRWLTPCVEKPPLTVSHTLNSVSDYFTLSHAYILSYVLFLQNRRSFSAGALWLYKLLYFPLNVHNQAGPLKDSPWRVFCSFSLCVLYSSLESTWISVSLHDVFGVDRKKKKSNIPFTPNSCTPIIPQFVGSGKEIANHVTLKYTERESLCMGNKLFSLKWGKQKTCVPCVDVCNISDALKQIHSAGDEGI